MLQKRKIEILDWASAKSLVKEVNLELYKIIEKLNPSSDFKLIRATYLFGDLIVKNGTTYFPNGNGALVTIERSDLPQDIKDKLGYTSIPLFLTLKNDNEVFADTGRRAVPINLFHAGGLLGVFETLPYIFGLQTCANWCVSAGSRSIILIPKISDSLGIDQLRFKYGVPTNIDPSNYSQQWYLFKAIAQHPNFEQSWENEVLFFTQDWFRNKGSKWQNFNEYLFKEGWKQLQYSVGRIGSSLQWEISAELISLRNLKPRAYLADQLKHILSLYDVRAPAFQPAFSQTTAPLLGLKKVIVDTYSLKHYLPTMMCINTLHDSDSPNIYYSLSFPTLLEGSVIDKATSTIMIDLRKIKQLIDTIHERGNKHYTDIVKRISYFHVERDPHSEIKTSDLIVEEDHDFLKDMKMFPNRKFCSTSTFWRGCIKITVDKIFEK